MLQNGNGYVLEKNFPNWSFLLSQTCMETRNIHSSVYDCHLWQSCWCETKYTQIPCYAEEKVRKQLKGSNAACECMRKKDVKTKWKNIKWFVLILNRGSQHTKRILFVWVLRKVYGGNIVMSSRHICIVFLILLVLFLLNWMPSYSWWQPCWIFAKISIFYEQWLNFQKLCDKTTSILRQISCYCLP